MQDFRAHCNLACRETIGAFDDAIACGVVDLESGEMQTVHHCLPMLPQQDIRTLADCVIEMFAGTRLRKTEALLTRSSGNGFRCPDEVFVHSGSAFYFMKSIPKQRVVMFLITRKTANQGIGWLTVRRAVGDLKRAVTKRVMARELKAAAREHLEEQVFGGESEEEAPSPQKMRTAVSHSKRTIAGELKDFGLTGILQLISQQKKSGRLQVDHPERDLSIVFEEGLVVSSWFNDDDPSLGLTERLLRRNRLPTTELRRVRRRSSFRGLPLYETLVETGHVDRATLEGVASELILGRIFQSFAWESGHYAFFPDEKLFSGLRIPPVEVDKIVFQAALIQDELPRIRSVLPDDSVKLHRLIPDNPRILTELSSDLAELHRWLPDIPTPLERLKKIAPKGDFELMKALFDLHEAGVIATDAGIAPPPPHEAFGEAPVAQPQGFPLDAAAAAAAQTPSSLSIPADLGFRRPTDPLETSPPRVAETGRTRTPAMPLAFFPAQGATAPRGDRDPSSEPDSEAEPHFARPSNPSPFPNAPSAPAPGKPRSLSIRLDALKKPPVGH